MSWPKSIQFSNFSGASLCLLISACSVDDRKLDVQAVTEFSGANSSSPGGMSPTNVGSDAGGEASEASGEGTAIALPIAPATAGSGGTGSMTSGEPAPAGAPGNTPSAATPPAATPAAPTPPDRPDLPDREITVELSGTGRVTSIPEGIDCPGVCTARFTGGSSVQLRALGAAESGSYFEGWSGDCSGFESCVLVVDRELSVAGSFGPANIAFVTSTTVDPSRLGGLAAADQICQTGAGAVGLPGTYVAWLSDSTGNAIDRIRVARGWIRRDGLAVADTADLMVRGKMFHPIRVNELGIDVGQTLVLTGTDSSGAWNQNSCGNWNSTQGLHTDGASAELGSFFTDGASNSCSNLLPSPLYCFGIDRAVRVDPIRSNGRLAFISSGAFSSGGGIAAADALCQAEVQAAGLGGTFLAELALAGALPEERFNLNGAPWIRPDGVLLATTAAGYFHDAFTDSAPNLTLQNEYHAFDRNWYGLTINGQATVDSTCANWTSTTASTGIVSTVASTVQLQVPSQGNACSSLLPIICLQN